MTNSPKAASTEPKPQIPERPLLSQLAGMPEARAWGEALAQDIALYKAGRIAWSDIDAGCVLYGPPGTGKTTFARAIAATAKVPLIATSYAEWARGTHYGAQIINAMRATFKTASDNAPCVVAIDELDSLPARASLSSEHVSTYAIVNALLEQLDGLNRRPGIIVIGACNHYERLDPALVRPGRLGRSIHIPLPALDALPQIIAFHLGDDTRAIGELFGIAVLCVGMSGAVIEQLVRDARQRARRAGRSMQRADLIEVLEAKSKRLDPQTQWRIALHEAGHAVAAHRRLASSSINISIVATDSGGWTLYGMSDRPLTRQVVADRLLVMLAGRAAEDVFLGEVSGAAGGPATSDLAQATKLALDAVASFGLSAANTLLWHGATGRAATLHYPAHLVAEADALLIDAYCQGKALIQSEREFAERVAQALVKQRALSHKDFIALDRKPAGHLHPLVQTKSITGRWRLPPRYSAAVRS